MAEKVIIDGRTYKLLPNHRLHVANSLGDASLCLVDEEGDIVPVDDKHYAVLTPGAWYTSKLIHEIHGSLHDNFWKAIEEHVRNVLVEELQLSAGAIVPDGARRQSVSSRVAARGMLNLLPRQRYGSGAMPVIVRLQARWRGAYVRKQFLKNLDERRLVLVELLDAEEFYVGNMDILLKFYEEPLRKSRNSLDRNSTEWERALSEDRVDLMFSEVRGILSCHEALKKIWVYRLKHWSKFQRLGDVIVKFAEKLKSHYETYSTCFAEALSFLRVITQSSPFGRYLNDCQQRSDIRLELQDLLVMPMQRFPHYILLFQKLYSLTSPVHPDQMMIVNTLDHIQYVADYVEQRVSLAENRQKAIEIQRVLLKSSPNCALTIPEDRYYVRDSPLVLLTTQNERVLHHLYLFNDCVVCALCNTEKSSALSLEVQWIVQVSKINLVEESNQVLQTPEQLNIRWELEKRFREVERLYSIERRNKNSDLLRKSAAGLTNIQKEFEKVQYKRMLYNCTYGLLLTVVEASKPVSYQFCASDSDLRDAWIKDILAVSDSSRQSILYRTAPLSFSKVLRWIGNDEDRTPMGPEVFSSDPNSLGSSLQFLVEEIEMEPENTKINMGAQQFTRLFQRVTLVFRQSDDSDASDSSSGHVAQRQGPAVRWETDAVLIHKSKRTLIHIVLLSHAFIIGRRSNVPNVDDTQPYTLFYMSPLARINLTAVDDSSPNHDRSRLEKLKADMERMKQQIEVETNILKAAQNIEMARHGHVPGSRKKRSASTTTKLIRNTSEQSMLRLEKLRSNAAIIQEELDLNDASFAVKLQITNGSNENESYVIALATREQQHELMLRVSSLKRTSLLRFLRLLKRNDNMLMNPHGTQDSLPSIDEFSLMESQAEVELFETMINDALLTNFGKKPVKAPEKDLFIAKMNHYAQSEDELMFLAGEEVTVINQLNHKLWLAICKDVIGVVDPKMLFHLNKYGMTSIPSWSKKKTESYTVVSDRRASLFDLNDIVFYVGEIVQVPPVGLRELNNGRWIGKCHGVIGMFDPKLVKPTPMPAARHLPPIAETSV